MKTYPFHGRDEMLLLACCGGHDPTGVSAQSPAGDRPDQRFLVLKGTDEPTDKLAQMRGKVIDTAWYQITSGL